MGPRCARPVVGERDQAGADAAAAAVAPSRPGGRWRCAEHPSFQQWPLAWRDLEHADVWRRGGRGGDRVTRRKKIGVGVASRDGSWVGRGRDVRLA